MNSKLNSIKITRTAISFLRLKNSYELSILLQIKFEQFKHIIYQVNYKEFKIKKTKGGYRTIEAPNPELLFLQTKLNKILQALYLKIKPESSFGFIAASLEEKNPHSIITNAEKHLNKNYVLNLDLKDFFHSISASQIRAFFQSSPFNFSVDLSTCLALICCFKGRLPMGAPTSPVISNLICISFDNQLSSFAAANNLTFTRYADDITFSSNSIINEELILKIKKIIIKNNFILNEKKYRMQSKFRQQSVTGIKVNTKLNVDRRYIRQIRAILHNTERDGLKEATLNYYKAQIVDDKLILKFLKSLKGKINFVGQVRGVTDGVYRKLTITFDNINNSKLFQKLF